MLRLRRFRQPNHLCQTNSRSAEKRRLWVAFRQKAIIIIVVLASAPRLVAVIAFMITARQSRAARALLGWKQETLADTAQVSLTALRRLESENGLRVYESTRDQVRRALERNGIVFLTIDKGEGVMIMDNGNAEDSGKRL